MAAVITAIAALHWFRPEMTVPILHRITEGGDLLKGLLANTELCVHHVVSLPWGMYYDQATALCQSIESWLTFLETVLSKAGYPWAGRLVHVVIYIVAIGCVWALAVFIRWLFGIMWAVTASVLDIFRLVLYWIFIYPVRVVFGHWYGLYVGMG